MMLALIYAFNSLSDKQSLLKGIWIRFQSLSCELIHVSLCLSYGRKIWQDYALYIFFKINALCIATGVDQSTST